MWYEIKIKTKSNALEAIYPILHELKLDGIVTEDPNDPIYSEGYEGDWDYFEENARQFEYDGALVKGYIELKDGVIEDLCKTLNSRIIDLSNFGFDPLPAEVSAKEVKEEDWANEWKQYYHTFSITDDIIIKPVWETYTPKSEEIVVTIDPGRAFGTGTHETTTLCARLIKKYSKEKHRLYDIGCGSGILSIIAKHLGYQTVIGVDIDEGAVSASRENARLNFSDESAILYSTLSIDAITEAPADLIVANIIADVIIDMTPNFKKYLKEHGILIASGILLNQADRVQAALEILDFTLLEKVELGEWCAMVFKR